MPGNLSRTIRTRKRDVPPSALVAGADDSLSVLEPASRLQFAAIASENGNRSGRTVPANGTDVEELCLFESFWQ
jgi:hypothetical protein